jgi:succinate dehydrogenase/fumarate reductase flavoprotein subunit
MPSDPLTIKTDIVVIGGGGSGLAAAAEAARLGRSVILLEKEPNLGGSTAWSVGSISATNTPHQQAAGIKDTPDEHFEDLGLLNAQFAGRDNPALRRLLVDRTNELIEWLTSIGLVFMGPMSEDPHRYPRMHNVLPNSHAFPYHLGRHCRRLGVDIRLNTAATSLIEEDGRVTAVQARRVDGTIYAIRASGGVILASGDFSASPELKARYAADQEVANVDPVNPAANGTGLNLALDLGAEIVNGDIIRGPILRFIPPTRPSIMLRLPPWRPVALFMRWAAENLPAAILRPFMMSFLTTALGPSPDLFREGAILINKQGTRFADEMNTPAKTTAKQTDAMAYIVFDQALADKLDTYPYFISTAPGIAYAYLDDYRRNRSDIFHTATTLEDLATRILVPPDALNLAVTNHNRTALEGSRRTINQPKYYALGPVKAYVVLTEGGLRVNERLEVLRGGIAIPGLYAAGSSGQGGALLEGHGHHLGWAFISGRIAGRNAAFEVPPATRSNRAEMVSNVDGHV